MHASNDAVVLEGPADTAQCNEHWSGTVYAQNVRIDIRAEDIKWGGLNTPDSAGVRPVGAI